MKEVVFKVFLIVVLAVVVMYFFREVEGFTDCEIAFTAKDTIVALKSVGSLRYLKGTAFSKDKYGWKLEKSGDKNCSVNIKDNENYLNYDIREKNSISLLPSVSENSQFYVTKISDSYQKELYQKTIKYMLKNKQKVMDLYVIVTSLDNPRYITVDLNNIYLRKTPTISSVWEIEFIKKGEIKEQPFEPTEGVGDFPNKENKYGAYMPSFNKIWNRTWWSPGNKKDETIQISVEMNEMNNEKSYNKGIVRASVVKEIDYENPMNSKEVKADWFNGLNSITFSVESISSNTLFGTNKNSTLILKMLPNFLKDNIPLIQGFIISDKKTIPLCAMPEQGVVQNLMGVCKSLNKDMDIQQFMLKNGLNKIEPNNNFNISKNLVNSSNIKSPEKNWVKFMKEDNLKDWSYGNKGMTPLPNDGLSQFTAKIPEVSSINECVDYASGKKYVPDLYVVGVNPVTNKKLTSEEVSELTDRGIFYYSDDVKVDKEGNYVSGKKGSCNLGMYGNWEPTSENGIGFVRRSPIVNMDKDFKRIGSVGTYIDKGESLEGFTMEKAIIMPNIKFCADLCKKDQACTEFSYDATSKECKITSGGVPEFSAEAKKDQVYSYQYEGVRNKLSNKNYDELEKGNYLGGIHQIIDMQGNKVSVPLKNVMNINDCAKKCDEVKNCDRFSWNADNGDCYLQSMGEEQKNKNLFYSGKKKNFEPQLTKKYSNFYPPKNKTVYSGRPIPNNSSIKNVGTFDECVDKCNSDWCGFASYNSNNKTCKLFLEENEKNTHFLPGNESDVSIQKINPPNAFLSEKYLQSFNQTEPASHFEGGTKIKTQPSTNADECAQYCLNTPNCDAFTYEGKLNECSLYQTGNCNDPNSPDCGKLVKNSESPYMYSSKMTSAMEDKEFHTVNTKNKCRGNLYCAKNFENNLPSSWSNAVCSDVVAVYNDGSEVQYDCNTIPPEKNSKDSLLSYTKIKCESSKGNYSYKESGELRGKDCNIPLNARVLLGNDLKEGTCDCNSYASKINFGKKELDQKEANWKGAKAVYAKQYVGVPDINFTENDKNVNVASNPEKGKSIACYVEEDDSKQFKNENVCSSNSTEYQCVLI